MAAVRRRRFSWWAFVLALVVFSPIGYRWFALRYHGEKGFAINWYEEMAAPFFYALAAIVPLAAAVAAGRLVASRRWSSIAVAFGLLIATSLMLIEIIPGFTRWDERHGAMAERTCRRHLRQLAVAMRIYAEENDGRLPLADIWTDTVLRMGDFEYLLRCPAAGTDAVPAYAVNAGVVGASIGDLGEETPLLFDARRDAASPRDAALRHPRRWGQIVPVDDGLDVVFADGRTRWVSESEWETRFGGL